GSIALTSGQLYDITLEYYQNTGTGSINLKWVIPGSFQGNIAQQYLYPDSVPIIVNHPGAVSKDQGQSASFTALASGHGLTYRNVVPVARLEGGVYLNCGSAVVLPEVFLKAVAIARNDGRSLDGLTTVNLDFLRQYRPQTNVVSRPTAGVGKGYSLTGHHELLIPLLAAALIEG
ncbi:MAG: hypothetical protein EBS05_13200, partial [Proteobacteria bacterium]|nr:hypothetical protein [Pseudomonadota bacterium]